MHLIDKIVMSELCVIGIYIAFIWFAIGFEAPDYNLSKTDVFLRNNCAWMILVNFIIVPAWFLLRMWGVA